MSPTKRARRFESWGCSRLEDWEGCPLYAKLKHLDKCDCGPAGPALAEGREIHVAAERYVRGQLDDLPDSLSTFSEEFTTLRKDSKRVRTELQLGLDRFWDPCSWFGVSTWLRMVLDVLWERDPKEWTVVDYKTGKRVDAKHKDQLSLYALGVFAINPKLDRVRTELWYTKPGELVEDTFCRADVPQIRKRWEARVAPLLEDTVFLPTPGDKCRFCPFKAGAGGQCKY